MLSFGQNKNPQFHESSCGEGQLECVCMAGDAFVFIVFAFSLKCSSTAHVLTNVCLMGSLK